jgi:hypothetical protein
MTLTVPTQNRLHLTLINKAGVSRIFDQIPLPWWRSTPEPPVNTGAPHTGHNMDADISMPIII